MLTTDKETTQSLLKERAGLLAAIDLAPSWGAASTKRAERIRAIDRNLGDTIKGIPWEVA